MKETQALVNDPLKVSLGILSACQGMWASTIGLQALLGSGNWVGLLNCASPPGAELEESSKNTKKLDAMTLIKEGGSQHPEGWASGDWTTFPSSTGGSSLKQKRDLWGKPPFDRSESVSCPGSWDL